MRILRAHPTVVIISLSLALARQVRRQGVFAASEICKGLVIIGIGDMATADQLGELIVIASQALRSPR